jgi:hypothetical protein
MKHRSVFLAMAALLVAALVGGCSSDSNPVAANNPTDTSPPPAPINVRITESVALHAPVLTWDPSTAPDVVGYDVYQFLPDPSRENSYVKLTDQPMVTNEFRLPTVQEPVAVFYRVRAVDLSGNVSAASHTSSGRLEPVTGGTGGDNPSDRHREN